jgi:isoleucyl-tRNA synthetase
MDNWDPANYNPNFVPENILDRWIVSRLYSLLRKINENVAKYDSTIPAEALEEFIVSDFSQWYIRRSRDRVGTASISDDKSEYYQTAYTVLFTLAKILAPFTPFIAEQMYLNLKQNDMPESVHLMQWPNEQNELVDVSLEEEMKLAREIVEKIHSKRKELSFKVRQPLAQVTVSLPKDSAVSPQIVDIILDEVNIKNMVFAKSSSDVIEVELDVRLTPELVEEGLIRDLIRHMQTMRRDAGYQFDREVKVAFSSSNEDLEFIHSFEDDIRKRLIAKDIVYNQLLEGDIESLFDADGKNIKVALKAV